MAFDLKNSARRTSADLTIRLCPLETAEQARIPQNSLHSMRQIRQSATQRMVATAEYSPSFHASPGGLGTAEEIQTNSPFRITAAPCHSRPS